MTLSLAEAAHRSPALPSQEAGSASPSGNGAGGVAAGGEEEVAGLSPSRLTTLERVKVPLWRPGAASPDFK